MPSVRSLASALFALLVLCVPAAGAATPPASDLFVVRAAHGSLLPLGGDRFVLELRNVDAQTTWFTDRPQRSAGTHSTAGFFGAWSQIGLAATPPNAAITLAGGDARSDTLIVELGKPRYDRATRTLRVKVRRLDASTKVASGHERRADRALPRRFGRVSLFIDPAYAKSVTVQVYDESGTELTLGYGMLTGGSWEAVPVPGTTLTPGGSLAYENGADNAFVGVGGSLMLFPASGGTVNVQWSWPPGSAITASASMNAVQGLAVTSTVINQATSTPTVQVFVTNASPLGA